MMFVTSGCGLIGLLLVALSFAFWIWMLVDCVTNTSLTDTEKILWFLLIFFLHFVGALIYYLVGKKRIDAG
jgi:hypothetical protein